MTFLAVGCIAVLATLTTSYKLNDEPIIGVLAQEYFGKLNYGNSYIAASYVKYLEAAGARVIPVFINQSLEYYADVINNTNGLLFPGGATYFNRSDSGYGNAGKILLKLATQANDRGEYYPVWGTCLGFELLIYLTSGLKWWLSSCSAFDMALPLEFIPGVKSSRILNSLPSDIKKYLAALPVTANYHRQCITPEDFRKAGLDKTFQVLSLNEDSQNITYVSTIEGINYPFYGTAWHPEKNQFEFGFKKNLRNIPHSFQAIRVGQHFANFFVNEARLSSHHFPSIKTEQASLIYNYQPVYTYPSGSTFEQCYFFDTSS